MVENSSFQADISTNQTLFWKIGPVYMKRQAVKVNEMLVILKLMMLNILFAKD